MHAEKSSSALNDVLAGLVAAVGGARCEDSRRDAWCEHFDRLYTEIDLHPEDSTPGAVFESAARSARQVSMQCLPLGLAVVMHLYPFCALKCVPLPWWSPASLKRSRLLRDIEDGGLVLANAGSERVTGTVSPVRLTRSRDGVVVNGTFDYVSLAHVADLVFFSAEAEGHVVFCAADACDGGLRVGASRFSGSMQLSDTCALTFENFVVPAERCMAIPAAATLHCMSQYQRSWFHLLLAEAYSARIEHLHRHWDLPGTTERLASLNELAFLRRYSVCLLEDAASSGAVDSLTRVTAAVKLRVSLMAQATADAIRERDATSAGELGFIRRQPTCDEKILGSLVGSIVETDEGQKLAS